MFSKYGFMPFFVLLMLGIFLSVSCMLYADTDVGLSYSQVADEVGWGVTADSEFELNENLNAEVSLNGQNTGSLYQGKLVAEVGLPIGGFEIAVASETKLIGAELNTLGRDTTVGLKGTALVGEIGIIVGVFGANAGEFGSRNAHDILVEDNNFDFRQLEGLGLEKLTAPSSHLSIKDGSRLNLRVGLETALFNDRFELGVSVRPEIGASDNPVHQLIVTGQTGLDISKSLKLVWQGELGIQTWEDGYEKQFATNFLLNFTL